MAVNAFVQNNDGFLRDIILLTQALIFVWFDDIFFFPFISLIADGPHHYHPACGHKGSSHLSLISYIITILLTMYYSVFCFVMIDGSAWRLI